MKKKLFIISNESVSSQDGKFYCDNIELKSTPEGLNKKFEVNLFARKSPVPGLFTHIFFFDNFSFFLIFFIDTIDEKANLAVFFFYF